MEKMIILSGCEGPDEELVTYLGMLFPGCSIEIVQGDEQDLLRAKTSPEEIEGCHSPRVSKKREILGAISRGIAHRFLTGA